MRIAAAVGLLVLLLALAPPLEQRLRANRAGDPPATSFGTGPLLGGVLTGSFRPVLLTYLWLRADILYAEGRHDELLALYRTMTALYPHNERARLYFGWHLAFNVKGEAPDERLAWTWAREGLDILADLPSARRTLADWTLKQCGQNALALLRYAGEGWETERRWRKRLSAWARERYGSRLSRFEVGLAALGDADGFFDRLRRANLLVGAANDDFVRSGASAHAEPAAALCDVLAREFAAEGLQPYAEGYRAEARRLRALAAGGDSPDLAANDRYETAACLWGIGAARREVALLEAAREVLASFRAATGIDCPEEIVGIRAWIEHLRGPGGAPPPPLPFDEMP